MQQMISNIQSVMQKEMESISTSLDKLASKIDTHYQGMVSTMETTTRQTNERLE